MMHRVMLMDDGYLYIELLKHSMDWESIGFTVSASVKNSDEALALIKLDKPDALIMDVSRSLGDRLELVKNIYALYPEIRLVLLSEDYNSENMKAAFQVRAVDYVIKPLDIEDLKELMKRVKAQCEDVRQLRSIGRTRIAHWIRRSYDKTNTSPDFKESLISFFSICFNRAQAFYVTLLTINELKYLGSTSELFTPSQFSQIFDDIAGRVNGVLSDVRETKFFLITAANPEQQIRAWKQEYAELQAFVTVCLYDEPVEIDRIPGTLSGLAEYCGWYVYRNGSGNVIFKGEIPYAEMREDDFDDNINLILPRLADAIGRNDVGEIHSLMDSFYSNPNAVDLHNQTMSLLDRLYAVPSLVPSVANFYIRRMPAFFNRLLGIESVALLKNVLTQHIITLAEEIDNALQINKNLLLVQKVREYIENNYNQDFSVKKMSQFLNYSLSYLHGVYKKQTGETITEALTKMRMRHAYELLFDKKLTIQTISSMVGYTNPSYFCNQFMKIYGKKPQQVRKNEIKEPRGAKHE